MPQHFIVCKSALHGLHSVEKLRFVKGLAKFLELLRSSKSPMKQHPEDELSRIGSKISL
jgi:hypothetical protein